LLKKIVVYYLGGVSYLAIRETWRVEGDKMWNLMRNKMRKEYKERQKKQVKRKLWKIKFYKIVYICYFLVVSLYIDICVWIVFEV